MEQPSLDKRSAGADQARIPLEARDRSETRKASSCTRCSLLFKMKTQNITLAAMVFVGALTPTISVRSEEPTAGAVLDAAKVRFGLVVHVGASDGSLALAGLMKSIEDSACWLAIVGLESVARSPHAAKCDTYLPQRGYSP